MIKTITKITTGIVLTLGLSFTSCKKAEKGDTGPAGANGNANVIGTNVVTINSWTASGAAWYAILSAPGITSSIVDK